MNSGFRNKTAGWDIFCGEFRARIAAGKMAATVFSILAGLQVGQDMCSLGFLLS